MKKTISLLVILVLCASFFVGCSSDDTSSGDSSQETSVEAEETNGESQEVPEINMAWDYDLHATVMLIATAKGEEFKDSGIWLEPIIDLEKYGLYKDGEEIAVINTIVTKGSSESAVMLGQGQLDCALNSVTGMLSAKDQGTDIKALCPVHVDGIGMVFSPDIDLSGWEEVEEYIRDSENPVRIGYHSPTSAPRFVVETSLKQAGLDVTEDPNNPDADVLLVDLKGSSNLLPAFTGAQVDAWVGPSHYPETAEIEGIGNIALKLNEFPPEGQWYDFPCCVFAARGDMVEEHPEVFESLVDLFTYSGEWATENEDEASTILADIIGIDQEAVEAASIVYTTNVSDKWIEGIELYFDLLTDLDKFDGDLKDSTFDVIEEEFFYFDFLDK